MCNGDFITCPYCKLEQYFTYDLTNHNYQMHLCECCEEWFVIEIKMEPIFNSLGFADVFDKKNNDRIIESSIYSRISNLLAIFFKKIQEGKK